MNLLKRTLTALVLLPLAFLAVLYFSRFWFFVLIQIIILAALVEFYNLPRRKNVFATKGLGILVSLILAVSFYYPPFFIEMALFVCLLAGGVFYLVSVTRLEKLALFPTSIAFTYFGALYLSFTLNHVIWLRDYHGPKYIFFLMTVVFVGDTGAMLIGKWLGRHKMAPIASPNKTWEGSIAGLATGAAAGVIFQQLFLAGESTWIKAALFGILIQMVSQISDPLESLFKRAAGVKDSSNLLPGHGGFFDRIDSLILAIPLFYYLLEYIGML